MRVRVLRRQVAQEVVPEMESAFTLPTEATEGFKDASHYDAYRPTYPVDAVEALLKNAKVSGQPHQNIVEIGSGTGKFTELLADRAEGFNVVAVEPHALMREQLVAKQLRNVKVVEGHASKTPVSDEWGDCVIIAQAFHWFANKEALREMHRVLKPNGILGLVWNIDDYNKPATWRATTAWEQELNELIFSLSNDPTPRFRDNKWQDVFVSQPQRSPLQVIKDSLLNNLPLFSLPLGEDRVPWTVWLTPDDLWRRFTTLSQVAILQGESREQVKHKFETVLRRADVERNEKGEVASHGVTYLAWSDKI